MRVPFGYIQFFLLPLLCLFNWIESSSQPPAPALIDSLQQALSNSRSDSQRVRLLIRLSGNYFSTRPDSGVILGRKAIDLARKSGLLSEEAQARTALAACLWGVGQHLKAIDEYRLSLPVAEKTGNRRMQAQIQHGIAINYGAIGKKDKAIDFLKKSLALQLQDGNDSGAMGCYHNLAQYSNEWHQNNDALRYYEQALVYAQRARHERGIAYTYMQLGVLQATLGNPTQGMTLLNESLNRFEVLRDTSGMAECWAMQAQVNRQQRRYPQAISCFRQAIRLQKNVPGQFFQRLRSGYLMELAAVYQEAPQTKNSFQQIREAWTDALKLARTTKDWQASARSAEALSQLYRKSGQPALALTYYEEYIRNRDSFLNIEKEKEKNLHELQTQYNDSIAVMKKLQDKQLLILRQESALREAGIWQTRLYAFIGIVLLALLLSILLYRNRIQKLHFKNELQQSVKELEQRASELQKQISEATLSALHAQMNPHFIFNSLNVIQSFVYTGNKEQASHLIGTFSDLVRQTLQFSKQSLISLEEELSFIRAYTELEVNRMGPDLSITYQIEPELDLKRILIPPLLIQPFVENALRHGLYHKEGSRRLHITVSGTTESTTVEIDDNGVGREAAKSFAKKDDHLAFSSGANEQRIALLNQLGQLKLDLHMIDKTGLSGIPSGTTVQLAIKQNNFQK
jgi:tetratricopeptide (TPR) repeat protein